MPENKAKNFIGRWKGSGGAELANSQSFLKELCQLIGVDEPEPTRPDVSQNAYVFERDVTFHHGDGSTSSGRIDLYKRGCFVLESKQGVIRKEKEASDLAPKKKGQVKKGTATRGTGGWDDAMMRAFGQAQGYVRALPKNEGRPPFVLVVDVGHTIDIYSEFSRTGGEYIPFPDPASHRILLRDIGDPEKQKLLRTIWTKPQSLDPSQRAARVTRLIAEHLAELAKSLEAAGHDPQAVSGFLMRCLFTMFAEDVRLLPEDSFTNLLESILDTPDLFQDLVADLWAAMNSGGTSAAIRAKVKHFNGGLFANADALPLDKEQLELLLEAAKADWRDVEPAIFGTLLERALNPRERHKLGAHYTPRAYVERLVMPTLIEPLRKEWKAVQAAGVALARKDKKNDALKAVQQFHRKLCKIKILDPACGSGNFLYVALEHLKRLEGEIVALERKLGFNWMKLEGGGLTVSPEQFLGLEVNPRAAGIAELVLWIGYLQWYFRTWKNVAPAEPIIRDFKNIECRDALMDWETVTEVMGDDDTPLTRWDGHTTKQHPTTGLEVPDETAQVPVLKYIKPSRAQWPSADFIVGNPPFIGASTMRRALGDGYVDALHKTYDDIPQSTDFVMYWWDHAATLVRGGKVRRFGFITTNSLRQTFNRRIIQKHLTASKPLSLAFAIPDHPWVDSVDGADVRIAMSTGVAGDGTGVLAQVMSEKNGGHSEIHVELVRKTGHIHSDLTVGADLTDAKALKANEGISSPGVKLHGAGFIVTPEEAKSLGLGEIKGLENHIRQYRNGRDLTQRSRGVMVIDLFGLEPGAIRSQFPEVYQWIVERVKPERDQNNRASYRDNWWIFGEPRSKLRPALKGLPRYVATVETSKHRFFQFLGEEVMPDNMLVCIASDDAYTLGILSSRLHVLWALAVGSRLGVGNDPRYNKTRCFETFPFPATPHHIKKRIIQLAEELDAHRKRQLELHSSLTMTKMYNVLEKMRAGESLMPPEQKVHDMGLVAILQELHDRLDEAVIEAYGWDSNLTDDEILRNLAELNAERVQEEAHGKIRWIRREYQKIVAGETAVKQSKLKAKTTKEMVKTDWPKTMGERVQAVLEGLAIVSEPASVMDIQKLYKRGQKKQIAEILETLESLGQVLQVDDTRYSLS